MIVDDFDECEAEHADTISRLRVALAEAGYPDADVYWGGTGLFCDGAPDTVWDRACDLINEMDQQETPL